MTENIKSIVNTDSIYETLHKERKSTSFKTPITLHSYELRHHGDLPVELFNLEHTYISDSLLKSIISELHKAIPIFLDAQTGSGKNYWIWNSVYPEIHRQQKKILLLVSRSALKLSLKMEAIKAAKTNQDILLSIEGIISEHHFGDIDIYSYQDLASETLKCEIVKEDYGCIIIDECHYFISDSIFNTSTNRTLNFLIESFFDIPRIYMTATPEEIFPHIYRLEDKFCPRKVPSSFSLYKQDGLKCFYFKRDYSYLTTLLFESDKEIVEKIGASNTSWFIAVDTKSRGVELEKALIKLNKKVLFLTAENKQDSKKESFANLIREERFSEDVLIATKCLDVGITIRNSNISIINYHTNQTDFIQALGRKRINNKHDLVTLYLPKRTKKNLDNLLKQLHSQIDTFKNEEVLYPTGTLACTKDIGVFTDIYNGRFYHNSLAYYSLCHQIDFLEELKNSPEDYPLISAQLDWIGLSEKAKCRILEGDKISNEENKQTLIYNAIKEYIGQSVSKENLNELLKEFDTRTSRNDTAMGITTIRQILNCADLIAENTKDSNFMITYKKEGNHDE